MPTRFRVLYCGGGWLDLVPCIRRAIQRTGLDAEVLVRDLSRPLLGQLDEIDVVLPSNARFGAPELAYARHLRLIQQPAVGFEGIDLDAARAREVPVCNAPGTNAESVAEAALLLILALCRRLPRALRAFSAAEIGAPMGVELTGRKLGIAGIRGRAGTALSRMARGIGLEVEGVSSEGGRSAFLEMLERVDILSIHTPLNASTHGMLDDEAFSRMKRGSMVVNVARGPIIDRGALERALSSGHLGGVGLDVFWEEPWNPNDSLFQRDNVVVLPHIGGSTEESFHRIANVVARNIQALSEGHALIHRVDR